MAISGQIAGLGYTTAGGDLLDGKLTAFGYSPGAGSALEFIFTVTGGQMNTPEWYPSQVGVVLSDASFPGNFTHSFSNDALGMADSFAYPTADNAPEPSSMVMGVVLTVLSGLAYLVRSRFVSKVKPA